MPNNHLNSLLLEKNDTFQLGREMELQIPLGSRSHVDIRILVVWSH